MKIAVFSDIHSNLEGYEAVLEDINKEHVDSYCCGGDIVGYGADPIACIGKIKRLKPDIVAGNHDWCCAGRFPDDFFNPTARAAILWTRQQLGEQDRGYLGGLALLYSGSFTMVHGSLNGPERFEYLFGVSAARGTFLKMNDNQAVCFIGHTHMAGVFIADDTGKIEYSSQPELKIEKGKRYIANVGSVGQPRDADPRASYCIYDEDNKTIRIKRVEYDVEKAMAKIIRAGLPRPLADRLALGK